MPSNELFTNINECLSTGTPLTGVQTYELINLAARGDEKAADLLKRVVSDAPHLLNLGDDFKDTVIIACNYVALSYFQKEFNHIKINPEYHSKAGNTPLMFALFCHDIWRFHDMLIERDVLRSGELNQANQDGKTLIHLAVERDVQFVELLISYGADIEQSDNNGNTPFHTAMRKGDQKIISLLLNKSCFVFKANNASLIAPNLYARKITLDDIRGKAKTFSLPVPSEDLLSDEWTDDALIYFMNNRNQFSSVDDLKLYRYLIFRNKSQVIAQFPPSNDLLLTPGFMETAVMIIMQCRYIELRNMFFEYYTRKVPRIGKFNCATLNTYIALGDETSLRAHKLCNTMIVALDAEQALINGHIDFYQKLIDTKANGGFEGRPNNGSSADTLSKVLNRGKLQAYQTLVKPHESDRDKALMLGRVMKEGSITLLDYLLRQGYSLKHIQNHFSAHPFFGLPYGDIPRHLFYEFIQTQKNSINADAPFSDQIGLWYWSLEPKLRSDEKNLPPVVLALIHDFEFLLKMLKPIAEGGFGFSIPKLVFNYNLLSHAMMNDSRLCDEQKPTHENVAKLVKLFELGLLTREVLLNAVPSNVSQLNLYKLIRDNQLALIKKIIGNGITQFDYEIAGTLVKVALQSARFDCFRYFITRYKPYLSAINKEIGNGIVVLMQGEKNLNETQEVYRARQRKMVPLLIDYYNIFEAVLELIKDEKHSSLAIEMIQEFPALLKLEEKGRQMLVFKTAVDAKNRAVSMRIIEDLRKIEGATFKQLISLLVNGEEIAFAALLTSQSSEELEKLLHAKDSAGNTLLHHAVLRGHLDSAKLLIIKGSNLREMNAKGQTCLFAAIEGSKYYEKNSKNQISTVAKSKKTPLEVLTFLLDDEIVIQNKLINQPANDLNTPLHIAAALGEREMVLALLERGADKTLKNENDKTPAGVTRDKTLRDLIEPEPPKKPEMKNTQVAKTVEGRLQELNYQKDTDYKITYDSPLITVTLLHKDHSHLKHIYDPFVNTIDKQKRNIKRIDPKKDVKGSVTMTCKEPAFLAFLNSYGNTFRLKSKAELDAIAEKEKKEKAAKQITKSDEGRIANHIRNAFFDAEGITITWDPTVPGRVVVGLPLPDTRWKCGQEFNYITSEMLQSMVSRFKTSGTGFETTETGFKVTLVKECDAILIKIKKDIFANKVTKAQTESPVLPPAQSSPNKGRDKKKPKPSVATVPTPATLKLKEPSAKERLNAVTNLLNELFEGKFAADFRLTADHKAKRIRLITQHAPSVDAVDKKALIKKLVEVINAKDKDKNENEMIGAKTYIKEGKIEIGFKSIDKMHEALKNDFANITNEVVLAYKNIKNELTELSLKSEIKVEPAIVVPQATENQSTSPEKITDPFDALSNAVYRLRKLYPNFMEHLTFLVTFDCNQTKEMSKKEKRLYHAMYSVHAFSMFHLLGLVTAPGSIYYDARNEVRHYSPSFDALIALVEPLQKLITEIIEHEGKVSFSLLKTQIETTERISHFKERLAALKSTPITRKNPKNIYDDLKYVATEWQVKEHLVKRDAVIGLLLILGEYYPDADSRKHIFTPELRVIAKDAYVEIGHSTSKKEDNYEDLANKHFTKLVSYFGLQQELEQQRKIELEPQLEQPPALEQNIQKKPNPRFFSQTAPAASPQVSRPTGINNSR